MTEPTQEITNTDESESWKQRTYITGIAIGSLAGLFSAYLFARAAEENEDGKPQQMSTGTLISLTLAVLGLVRQIAESGKQKKK